MFISIYMYANQYSNRSAMGLAEELVEILENEFPSYVVVEPESEECLHGLLYLFLRVRGYEVNYTGGRAKPDLVVARRGVEVPVEVKIASSSGEVDKGLEQLYNYMKNTEWKHGILFIWDKTEKGTAYSRAKEIGTKTKYGRTMHIVAVKR